MSNQRTRWRIEFEDCAKADDAPANRRMAQLLKIALRRLSLRCVRAEEIPPVDSISGQNGDTISGQMETAHKKNGA